MIETKKGRIVGVGQLEGMLGRWVEIIHGDLRSGFFVPASFNARVGDWLVAAVRNGCVVVMLFINGKRVHGFKSI